MAISACFFYIFLYKILIMKKLLLLLSFISLISCTNEENYYEKPIYMNPPTWIQGVWKDDKDRMIQFTEDDLLYKYPMQKYTSASNEITYYESKYWQEYQQYNSANIQEVELIDYYSLKYNCYNAPSKKFMFTQISDSQIESTGFMPGIYTRQ